MSKKLQKLKEKLAVAKSSLKEKKAAFKAGMKEYNAVKKLFQKRDKITDRLDDTQNAAEFKIHALNIAIGLESERIAAKAEEAQAKKDKAESDKQLDQQ